MHNTEHKKNFFQYLFFKNACLGSLANLFQLHAFDVSKISLTILCVLVSFSLWIQFYDNCDLDFAEDEDKNVWNVYSVFPTCPPPPQKNP